MAKAPARKTTRTAQALRDILFDEIEELRSGDGDPQKALAVAGLARQIVGTAKLELEFVRTIKEIKESGGDVELGNLQLGS